jgi:two-component system sensor histidine kinase VicK
MGSNRRLTNREAAILISYLINYPIKTAVKNFFIVISAFMIAALVITLGIIPQLKPLQNLAVIYTVFLGFIVAVTESLLNEIFLESRMTREVETIANQYPGIIYQDFQINRTPLFNKILAIVFLSTLAIELTFIVFFLSNTALHSPATFTNNLVFTLILVILNSVYILVIVPSVSKNLTLPLDRLVDWSHQIISGNLSSKVRLVSNDEVNDVVTAANQMINNVNQINSQLLDEQARLTASINSLTVGFIIVDNNYRILAKNQAAALVFNQPHLTSLNQIHSLTLKNQNISLKEEVNLSLNKKVTITLSEVNFADLILKLLISPINVTKNGHNQPVQIGAVILLQDQTNEVKLERSKDEFLAIASHELRTPLIIIKNTVAMIQDGIYKPEELNFALDQIKESSVSLIEMTDQFLDISKMEQKKLVLKPSSFILNDLIKEITAQYQTLAIPKNLKLFVQLPPKLIHISADRDRLSQVISNLLGNAIKFTDQGSITLQVNDLSDRLIKVKVTDTGSGIPKDRQHLLFKKFSQTNEDIYTRAAGGTGLGLYISKMLVELMGGNLKLDISEPGKGSTFIITLPVSA